MHVVTLVVVLFTACAATLHAQVSPPQLQAGAALTAWSLTHPDQTRSGLGGWFAWDVSRAIGIDASVSVFPAASEITGRQVQALAGLRSGVRVGRLAVFGRVRPGFVRFTEQFLLPEAVCILIFPPPESCLTARTNRAVDVGATFELRPGDRTVVRFDVGDTLIRFARDGQPTTWTHNLQIGAGAGLRF